MKRKRFRLGIVPVVLLALVLPLFWRRLQLSLHDLMTTTRSAGKSAILVFLVLLLLFLYAMPVHAASPAFTQRTGGDNPFNGVGGI